MPIIFLEAENVIERVVIFADERPTEPADLTFVAKLSRAQQMDPEDLKSAMRMYEKQHILQVLQQHDFDKQAVAQTLKIGLSSLYRKIDELGITKTGAEK